MGSRKTCCRKCAAFCLVFLGIPLLIAGIVVAVLGSFKTLAEDEIKEGLPLKSGSTSFENWEKPDGDLFIEYYVFNITNSSVANGNVPELKQLGPYTYREVSVNNVSKREGENITYTPSTRYFYDRARSCKNCDPEEDKILTINYPLLTFLRVSSVNIQKLNTTKATQQAGQIYQVLRRWRINLFKTLSVDEILWGYTDQEFSTAVAMITNRTVNGPPSTNALQFNNSGSGITKIHTGENDIYRVAEYLEWKGFRKLPWWNSKTANMINGTGGTRFRPFIDKDEELYAVVTEICRSLKLTYDSTVKVHGIELYRFTPPEKEFLTGDVNPDNKGFCVTGPEKKCLPSGLLDISVCKGSTATPFVASSPHFYFGDPRLSEMLKLKPEKTVHATFLDVEPNTGLTMQGHKRLQLNLAVSSFSIMNILLNVNTSSPVFLPVFFTDESAIISEDDADDFKKKVLLPLRVAEVFPFVMIALGGLCLLIILIIAAWHCDRMTKRQTITNEKGVVMENYAVKS